MSTELSRKIRELAEEKNAVILSHNYQNDDVQDVADYTGDSLELSRIAAGTNAKIIVFNGVHFMAESAYILSPDKKVLLPDINAGCPMADMADESVLLEMKRKHPDALVVTYINSSAAVKAVSDICCTSANAVDIVKKVDAGKIIFVPDKNLGAYVQRFTDKEIIPWKGYCPTHDRFKKEDLIKIKEQYPDAITMVHPECRADVIDIADQVFSTGGMVKFVQTVHGKKIIVGTEKGMIHKLKSVAPDNQYILASDKFVCPNMKKITLEKVYNALLEEKPEIKVDDETAQKALGCLDRMLALS